MSSRFVKDVSAAALFAFVLGCGAAPNTDGPTPTNDDCTLIPEITSAYADWPKIESAIGTDAELEARIQEIVAGMTTAQKVGQMVQGEINALQSGDVATYRLGSVLNGGGSWPGQNKHAVPAEWLALADQVWEESMATDLATPIPIVWGIDAVHGNNNVYGATVFPHNIGLGATRDPCLVRKIGQATAAQVRVTGQDWTFAPTLAVVRDDRWGRTYEGYSEDPAIVLKYAEEMVKGLQSWDAEKGSLQGIIATAKHYIGDGGTDQGINEGVNAHSELEMINLFGQGYYGALGPGGAQTVMVSFNSWTNADLGISEGKIHGSQYLVTEVLKGKIGFDGLVISDWNGHAQVSGCTAADCPKAVNAGIDMFMISSRDDVIDFIANTVAETELDASDANFIPISRIDDAVTRILRVKMRAGLFDAPKPSERDGAGDSAALAQRELARQAVRESLVLLKNDGRVLPLALPSGGKKLLVIGKSADSFTNQSGGWTLVWGGSSSVTNVNSDFSTGDTVLGGIRAAAGEANVDFDETASTVTDFSPYSAVIAVIGEEPYAESSGDISGDQTLEHALLHPEDLAVLDAVSGAGLPVVTVYLSGRPLYVNKELNRSDAFVAAFLPGTEGAGIADVLFQKTDGGANHDFTGRLSFSWPGAPCQTPINRDDPSYAPLFAYGYGLTYSDATAVTVGTLTEATQEEGCDPSTTATAEAATETLTFFGEGAVLGPTLDGESVPYTLYAGSAVANAWNVTVESPGNALQSEFATSDGDLIVKPATLTASGDAREAIWSGTGPDTRAQLYIQSASGHDLTGYYPSANAYLVFDVIVKEAPDPDTYADAVHLRIQSVWPNTSNLNVTTLLHDRAGADTATTLKIPLRCFDKQASDAANRVDFSAIDCPFLLIADRPLDLVFGNVRWLPDDGNQTDFVPCSQLPLASDDPT